MSGIVSRIFLAAILGGAIAGLFLAGVQQFAVVPIILEAETYETAGDAEGGHEHGAQADAQEAHTHEEAWAPADGVERTAYTVLADILAAVGFGLLLTAGYALRGGVDWRQGILWGLAGFAAFHLAPAAGLPPEIPGAAAADLGERQVWWVLTVALTAAGLAVIAFAPRPALKVLGAVLIVVPHIIGAPQPEAHGGLAPAELARSFIYASLVSNGVFWIVLGALTGFLFNRFQSPATD
jgi:cobalt transporter subunit CbtA